MPLRNFFTSFFVFWVGIVFLFGSRASAQIDWTNTLGFPGPWYDVGENWTGGVAPSGTQFARFNQFATYQVWFDTLTATNRPSVGRIHVHDGSVTFLNKDSFPQHRLTINGDGVNPGLLKSAGSLDILGIHVDDRSGHVSIQGTGIIRVDGSHSAGSRLSTTGVISVEGGRLSVLNGGLVESSSATFSHAFANVLIDGSASQWNTGNLVSSSGETGITVRNGGFMNSNNVTLGSSALANVDITVDDSTWQTHTFRLNSRSRLNILNGGGLISRDVFVSGPNFQANIGDRALWVSNRLNLNPISPSSMTIGPGGSVVTQNTAMGNEMTVNLVGGTFHFGETSYREFARINASSGQMIGVVPNSGITDTGTLTAFRNSGVDLSGVSIRNTGILYGSAQLDVGLQNQINGEVEIGSGERIRFGGTVSVNSGEINNFGGNIRFSGQVRNDNDGMIAGRGQFIADGSWQNRGVMAFSGGFTDVLGDVDNLSSGSIVTTGGGTTTFFDDVHHNGTEIRTSANSATVFLGKVSGAGMFSGTGDVYFEGDLRPGNSPGIVSFDGDVHFADTVDLFIELGGLGLSDFDQLLVAGDASLSGDLFVSLIDGHLLQLAQSYTILDILGQRTGVFNGLAEGALVNSFNGVDLFITYRAGDGNDVALFSAVPEPQGGWLVGMLCFGLLFVRNRQHFWGARATIRDRTDLDSFYPES